jgi:hypothetical protein
MQETLFVWLGSKRAKKRGVGEWGVLLDLATRAGLPVPAGGILLDDFYQLALEDALLVRVNGRITCPDPDLLHSVLYKEVCFPQIEKPVAVQAIFSPPDGELPPQCPINFLTPMPLAHSLCELYSLAQTQIERRDVLVMEMVESVVRGTAVTSSNQNHDPIHYQNQTVTLPQLRNWQRPDADTPAAIQRLQKLLRGIRRTFGQGDWHIEWTDDGHICWLWHIHSL